MRLNQLSVALLSAALAQVLAASACADVITDWNKITVDATKTGGLNSNLGTRIDAIEALAVYDAVNTIVNFGTPYHFHTPPTGAAPAEAAVAQAAHDVLSFWLTFAAENAQCSRNPNGQDTLQRLMSPRQHDRQEIG